RIHLADVGARPSRVLARREAVLLYPALDSAGDVLGDLAHAIQQHVAVAQQDAVVMVVSMAKFPEHLAVPVRFEDHPPLERESTEEALLRGAPVVEQGSAVGEVAR